MKVLIKYKHFNLIYLFLFTLGIIKSNAQNFPILQFSQMKAGGDMVQGEDGLLYIADNGKIGIWDGFKVLPIPMANNKKADVLGIESFKLKGNLIFISYTDGLSVYNKKTKQYIFYDQNTTDLRYKVKNNRGAKFFKSHNGQFYVQAGAFYNVNADLSLTEYKQLSKELQDRNLILDGNVFEDNQHVIWLNCKDSKLIKLTSSNTIERYYNLLSLKQNSFIQFQDSENRFWFYCWGQGLQLFDPVTGLCKPVNPLLSDIVIRGMCDWKDINGFSWIVCATDKGIRLLNPKTFEVKCFDRDHSGKIAKAKNEGEPRALIVDKENILWIINEGANNEFIAPARQQFKNLSLTTTYSYSKAPFAPRQNGDDDLFPNRISTPDSNVWIGALFGKGISVFTKQAKLVTNYPFITPVKNDKAKTFANFNCIASIKNDISLVSTYENVCVWDGKNILLQLRDEFSRNEKGEYRPPNFTGILPYQKDKWLIKSNDYIYLFDYNFQKLSRFFSLKDSSIVNVNPKQVRGFNFTKSGFWIMYETALLKYDTALHKITQLYSFEKKGKYYFPESAAMKFLEDKEGNLWVAGSKALLLLNTKTGIIKTFADNPNLNSGFNNLVFDNNQNLWLLSGSNIICYNYKKSTTRTFHGKGSLSGADGYGLWMDSTSNTIWICANKYLTVFNSDSVLASSKPHKPFISQIFQGDSIIQFDPQAEQYFSLPYDKSTITFHASFSYNNRVNEPLVVFRLNDNDSWKYSRTGDITFYNLGSGNYNLQISEAFSENEVIEHSITNIPFRITPPFYKSNWFAALFISIFGFIGYVIFKFRLSSIKAKANEKEKALQLVQVKTEFEKKLIESEMAALQSQMNPHFIFNVLNSINKYILSAETLKASEYLVSFSKLIRIILENSKSTKVSLKSDLEALELYIKMEKMRFEGKFESIIIVNKNIDTQFIMIPPLIIQPFVENAIWHGLMQKDFENRLEIEISEPEENYLKVIIKDNGIGRAKATELKSKSASKRKSFGMEFTKDRIGMLNKIFDINTSVQIVDLYDNDGHSLGTKVILLIEI